MEGTHSYTLALGLLILAVTFVLKLLSAASGRRRRHLNLPPGPPELPIIGSMHHILGSLPHHALRDLAKTYGPIMHLHLGEVPTVVVSSGEAAKEIMKTHDLKFSSRPSTLAARVMLGGGADLLFAPYGAYWRQMRRLCVEELLSAKRVSSSRSVREEEASRLVRTVQYSMAGAASSPVNLSAMIYSFTSDVIAKVAFGSECRDLETYLVAMKKALELAGGFNVADMFPSWPWVAAVNGTKAKLEVCHRDVDRIIEGIIGERMEGRSSAAGEGGGSGEENILDVLLNLQDRGGLEFPLTSNDIKAIIFDLFAGGSGSSALCVVWAMSELMRNPQVMKIAQFEVREALRGKTEVMEQDIHELSYLKFVIKETLRLHPPVPLLVPRECTAACQVQGYDISPKTRVVFNAWAMGRDPKYWDDVEVFKPERFHGRPSDFRSGTYEFIPFGAGRRVCPGIAFGLTSVELPLAVLLYHFDWRLPDGVEELDMSETVGLGSRRKFDLSLCASPCC